MPDNVGNVLAASVKPGRVDQNGGERHGQQYEAGQYWAKPELALTSKPRRHGGLPRPENSAVKFG